MVTEDKSKWETPELIVMARSRPEEAVLTACKGGTLTGAGLKKDYCQGPSNCGSNCSTIAAS